MYLPFPRYTLFGFPVGVVGAGVLGLVTVGGCVVGFVLSKILYVLIGYPNMFLRNPTHEFELISKKVTCKM